MARNAAPTLPRLLAHLSDLHVPVIFIDHGSTDATWDIARDASHGLIKELLREPFRGYFDLTRQLRLKRDIIASASTQWIMHVDADEFLITPNNDLAKALNAADKEGALAIGCDEYMFLPRGEDDQHRPDDFIETMHAYVPFAEKDPKQRVFRRDAPLDLWLKTGGHTVSRDQQVIASEKLQLNHYVGLSLDHLRSQYLPRIFSAKDRVKHWHSNRMGDLDDLIVEAAPGELRDAATGLDNSDPVSALPVMAPSKQPRPTTRWGWAAGYDLIVAGQTGTAVPAITEQIIASHSDMKVETVQHDFARLVSAGRRPLLHVLEDPRPILSEMARDAARKYLVRYIRGVTQIRQAALQAGMPYQEISSQDFDPHAVSAENISIHWQPCRGFKARSGKAAATPLDPKLVRIGGDFLNHLGFGVRANAS